MVCPPLSRVIGVIGLSATYGTPYPRVGCTTLMVTRFTKYDHVMGKRYTVEGYPYCRAHLARLARDTRAVNKGV
ncbi:hypothetical protein KN1_01790 [Stygiolobus caldivivus]|uniref:Uncharacterized protein n=1 Tax=Stygiolobus caldivivus TaxID=2824673 RepID=A0A8D5ZI10_9CREN|nr:hypothetical protein KN1_01790 [Stygiolobus caldivivus]